MNRAKEFIDLLAGKGMDFFSGVPDSRLAGLCAALQEYVPPQRHVIAANEGNALGLGIGHFLASARPAVVYMQNSGLGNAVNPLTSLADKEIYSVPMLLVIGWRGCPGEKDEPQHVKQGRISQNMLELLEIPQAVLAAETCLREVIESLHGKMIETSAPVALLVKEGAFLPEGNSRHKADSGYDLTREQALAALLGIVPACDCLLATTGKTGRELFELRASRGEQQQDFLCVGGMGHCSSIALGAALARPDKRFICLDGDGALLMHMGAMGTIGTSRPQNFVHVLLNNRCHESVGGQPTCIAGMDLAAIAIACGYASFGQTRDQQGIEAFFASISGRAGPHFLEISIGDGARTELGRPTGTPQQNKDQFMAHISKP